ncbi:MAG: hypothetical protein EKK46_09220 [Rhodocyclaceae bacterium]|nr:MAG: hypothetical protein EKK46_09220 [Rhodocyclaceae bacterium]
MNAAAAELLGKTQVFQTLDEARHLAMTLATLTPVPDLVEIGLVELMLNAIEHGNLGLSYQEKRRLLLEETLAHEVSNRLATPPYCDRRARITATVEGQYLIFLIEDDGDGFDWQHLAGFPLSLSDPNGRGIAMAQLLSFAHLEYLGKGNQVKAGVPLGVP